MIDFNNLTVGEAAKVEELSGQSLDSLAETNTPKVLSMAALAYVWKRRTDKAFSWNDALGLTMTEMRDTLGMNDDEEPAVTIDGEVINGAPDDGNEYTDPFPQDAGDES